MGAVVEPVQTELALRLERDLSEGLSRRDIARKAKVSEGTIRNALDSKPLTHDTVERLAKFYLKVPVDEAYRMAGILPRDEARKADIVRVIEHLVARLPASDQEEILEIIRMKVDRAEKGSSD